MQFWFGVSSLVLSTVSYAIYIRDILRGNTKPHAFSWLVWSLLGLTVFIIQLSETAGPGAWVNGYAGLACAVIFVLTIKYGDKHIKLADYLFLLAALAAYVLWLVTRQALLSIVLLTVIDFFGFLPTFRKSYRRPWEETANMYWLSAGKYTLSLFALSQLSMTNLLYPSALIVLNTLFTLMLFVRRYQLKR